MAQESLSRQTIICDYNRLRADPFIQSNPHFSPPQIGFLGDPI